MAEVLLIEPDNILARIISIYFGLAGHAVIHHKDLQQAIFAADQKSPAAVVAELQLAGRSGIEFLYEFRSYPEWMDVPVIVYTDMQSPGLTAYSAVIEELGIQRVMDKTRCGLNSLLAAVNLCLQPAPA